MFQVYHDNKLIKELPTEGEVMDFMHSHQPFSIDWACKHEGYKIVNLNKENKKV